MFFDIGPLILPIVYMKKLKLKKVKHWVKESAVFDVGIVVTFQGIDWREWPRATHCGAGCVFFFDLGAGYIGMFALWNVVTLYMPCLYYISINVSFLQTLIIILKITCSWSQWRSWNRMQVFLSPEPKDFNRPHCLPFDRLRVYQITKSTGLNLPNMWSFAVWIISLGK